jgi:hypothetical protein
VSGAGGDPDYRAAFERAMRAAWPDWGNPTTFWSPERDAALIQQIEQLTAEVMDLRAEHSEAVVEGIRGMREALEMLLNAQHCHCGWCRGETKADGRCGCAFCEHTRMNEEMDNR